MSNKNFTAIFGENYDEESNRNRFETSLTFSDKESYLKWVKEWKATLNTKIEEIRQLKKDRKMYLRDEKGNITGPNPNYNISASWKRQYNRSDITALLMQRYFSKQKAALQREANLQKVA